MNLTGENYIAGSWSAIGNKYFNAYSTTKNQKLETCFYEASIEEINNSVISAQQAAYSYAKKSNTDIANFLENIGISRKLGWIKHKF